MSTHEGLHSPSLLAIDTKLRAGSPRLAMSYILRVALAHLVDDVTPLAVGDLGGNSGRAVHHAPNCDANQTNKRTSKFQVGKHRMVLGEAGQGKAR